MGVRVNLTKRLVATASVALFAISLSGFANAQASQLKNSASPHPSPKATHKVGTRALPKTLSAPLTATAAQTVEGCAKTNATAHYPIKVGTPDPKVPQVDHIITLNTNC